jgi:hypothetical protein
MSFRQCISVVTAFAALAAAPLAQSGCMQIECGEGTIEQDGTCIPAVIDPDDAQCGEGTILEGGVCVPENTVVCDPTSTTAHELPDGTIVCEGTGTGVGCEGPINCPSPSPGNVTICGQIFDVETNLPIRADGATGAPCDPENPSADGPCSLEFAVYDAIDFAGDPQGTDQQDTDSLTLDDCGRFAAVGIDRPADPGFIGIGIDDSPNGANDDYVLGGVALPTESNEKITGFQAFAVRASTNQDWSDAAGLDPTFAEQGVYVPIYRYNGEPVENVVVTRGGPVADDQVYYFEDTDPDLRQDPTEDSTSTGVNGSALVLMSGLVPHSGSGGDGIPAECEFPSALAASIETIVFVQVKNAVVDGSEDELCPPP